MDVTQLTKALCSLTQQMSAITQHITHSSKNSMHVISLTN